MSTVELEKRIGFLENMFSNSTNTGLNLNIEKKIQSVIKNYFTDLENRTVAITDSKVDATDCYLKLKEKVNRGEFEKMLDQFLQLKKEFMNAKESNELLRKQVADTENKFSSEMKNVVTKFSDLQADSQEKFMQISTEMMTKDFSHGPQKKMVDYTEELHKINEQISKISTKLLENNEKIDKLEKFQMNSTQSVFFDKQ